MKVGFSRAAERQLDRIMAHVAAESSSSAATILATVRKTASMLTSHPDAGRPSRVVGVRIVTLPRLPYRIAYAVVREEIVILSVRHTSRRPSSPFQ